MNHTPQLHVHFVIIFKFLISHQLLFLPYTKHGRAKYTKKNTTKNTNTSQERNNFSVDMEEESSDMINIYMVTKLMQYFHQTIMQFFQSVMKGI